ncbi:uncharacterized protein K02A2.6-like [Corticium candelabrum]|uniref:uncharacterized protein K02A2.6-like n=1 Tax=Corticium candelabrum TaxID=121492 RepID=UPI002E32B098|nr:uncharacterized protein K02A2.6-like [Corticium candelabrum]
MSTATQVRESPEPRTVRESPEPRDLVHLTNVTVPLPERLNLKGNLAQNWRTFRRRWESFEVSSRMTRRSHKERVATFQQCLPAEALEVLDTLPFAEGEDRNDMAVVLRHMEAYCFSKTNVIYERYQLTQRAQKQGEPFDDYLISLRSMIRACNYGAIQDELLRDKIVHGIRNNDTRQKLLQEAKLTLATAISICRAAESTSAQAKAISFSDDVHALTAYSTRNRRRQATVTARVPQTCQYCGRRHDRGPRQCPALGKTCSKCGKANHFASVCRQKQPQKKTASPKQQYRIHRMEDDELDQTNYLMTITLTDTRNTDTAYSLQNSQETHVNQLYATMTVGGCPIRLQLDTGATCNVIRKSETPPGTVLQKSDKVLSLYNKSRLKPLGRCTLPIINPKTKQQHIEEFVVVADNEAATSLLGAGATQRLGLISVHLDHVRTVKHEQTAPGSCKPQTTTDTTSDLKQLLATYADVFDSSTVGQLPGMLHLDVDPTVPPVKMPLRKMPIAIQTQLKDELQRLERLDVIERVDTPTEWISSLVAVKKPNGKLRLCIDPKPLNKALRRSHYPMHTIDDLLPELSQAKMFSVCDVSNGFWHVKLDEESSLLTTFETPFGRYKWKRMPFGISPAPEVFQRRLDEALDGMPGVHTIADDILITGVGNYYSDAAPKESASMPTNSSLGKAKLPILDICSQSTV